MTVRNPVITRVIGQQGLDGWQVTWAGLQNGDTGAPVGSTIGDGAAAVSATGGGLMSGFADKTIQLGAGSTLGVGGSVAAEGSNDGGTSWGALTNPTGTVIALTALSAIQAITEAALWVRPHVTAGDGTTSITIVMFLRKTQTP